MEIKFRKDLGQLLDHFKLPRIVAELGNAEGLFSKQILEWGIDQFYMVDTWESIKGQAGDGGFANSWHHNNFNEAMERVSPWKEKVVVLRGLTKDMIPQIPYNHLGMVYIDAAHDYSSVYTDLTLSYPKVVSGGIISGHDYLNPSYGVNKAVHDFCGPQHLEIHVVPDEDSSMSSFWFRKP
jgi:hypothetical protein